MTKILNQSQHTTSPSTQQDIQQACVNMGYPGDVVLKHTNDNQDEQPVYDVYDLESNYLFSIDTDGDTVFSR